MVLTTENITVSAVKNAIGHPNYNLTAIVTDAKTGGTGGKAFDATTNYLIAGALPYWNIYAYNIPAEWVIDEGVLKLKRRYADGGFVSRLGDFREYNHEAQSPESYVSSGGVVNGSLWVGVETNLYEWNIPDTVTHILIKVTVNSIVQTSLRTDASLRGTVEGDIFNFTSVPTYVTSGTAKVYASDSNSSEVADITEIMTGSTTKTFTFTHSSNYGTLSRMIEVDMDVNLNITDAEIINPTGTSDILYSAGTTEITGINIEFVSTSTTVSSFTFDLYFTQTGENDLYIGNFYGYAENDYDGYVNTYIMSDITLLDTVAGYDYMSFYITNISY